MELDNHRLIIGLTGSFGSGATTFSNLLKEAFDYQIISLSTFIKKEATRRRIKHQRSNLQDLGDKIRGKRGKDCLAQEAEESLEKDTGKPIVFDSIKHPGEVEYFSKKYPNFCLFSLNAEVDERWDRQKHIYKKYGQGKDDFLKDDVRDKEDLEKEHGQQVNKCNLMADVMINNPDEHPAWKNFKKMKRYIDLINKSSEFVEPFYGEILMNHAFNISLKSSCLRRQVGAVIATKDNYILAQGFNETPRNIVECRNDLETNHECFLDFIRKCPKCDDLLDKSHICKKCNTKIKRLDLSAKNLDLCRAVHAEENAILQTSLLGYGYSLKDTTLYTTTFPCLLCAKNIITCGIIRVVYVESYPVVEASAMLKDAKVETIRYEGCLPSVYTKFYKEFNIKRGGVL